MTEHQPLLQEIAPLFDCGGALVALEPDALQFPGKRVPIRGGIPRFVDDENYSKGNFGALREKHATLQLDSKNKTTDRYDTLLERTGWPPEYFKGKLVLECGCGAGPDTEILLALGAKVVALDFAGNDIAKRNVNHHPNVCFIQADITNIPFQKHSFDIVFCHQVIQHTPDPVKTMQHLLQFVKPDGDAMIYSYGATFWKLCNIKYLLRPFTRKMEPEKLYRMIEAFAPYGYAITNWLYKIPLGYEISYACIPFSNASHRAAYKDFTKEQLIEYGIHETFDELSPRYDIPMRSATMHKIGAQNLSKPFTILSTKTFHVLRTTAS